MVKVQIVQTGACAACEARSMCMASESKEKEIDAYCSKEVKAGDKVEVLVAEKLGWKAILLAYVAPFAVLMLALSILDMYVESEALVGTVALCCAGAYYIGLSFFKGKLKKEFSFTARPIRD